LATGQKLILKLVELHSVLKAEEAEGTFKPTRIKRKAKRPTGAAKAARTANKQQSAA
jgi:hypothetical protein